MFYGKPRWNESVRDHALRRGGEVVRGPAEFSMDLCGGCHGGCLHCFNRSGRRRPGQPADLSDDEVRGLADQVVEMAPRALCLCGGEPLLRADLALELLARFSAAGISASMVTTGRQITPDLARALGATGVASVQVSLDGATAESHDRLRQRKGDFDHSVAALERLAHAGVSTSVSFCPTRFSADEFGGAVELARALGASDLRAQPLMPLGEALFHWEELRPTNEQYQRLVDTYRDLVPTFDNSFHVEWGDPVDHLIRFGQFYGSICHAYHITAGGLITPSVYLPVFVGDVRRHTLAEYWRAGLCRVWDLRLVRELAFRVRSVADMALLRPIPFVDRPFLLDLAEMSQAEVERLTDGALGLVRATERLRDERGAAA